MKMFEICKGIASECGRLLIVLLTGTIIVCGIDSSLASAEVVTVEGTGTYTIGDGLDENLSAAKERARMEAMRNASEKAGVYVEGISIVKEGQLTHDEIKAITATIMQVQGEPHFKIVPVSDSVITYQCVVVVKVDTDQVTQKMLADRQALAESVKRNKELEEENSRLELEMAELKRKYDNATSDKERQQIKQQVADNDNGIWVNKWLDVAGKFYDKGAYKEALSACDEAISIDSKSASALGSRALVYLRLNEIEKSLEDINQVIKIEPKNGRAYAFRGNVYADFKKDYSKAISDFTEAITLEPKEADWYNSRGWAYGNINEIEKALEDFDRAIDIYENCYTAYLGRGRVYAYHQHDVNKALKDYNRAIEINKGYIVAYAYRGDLYGSMGEYVKAIDDFSKYIEMNSNDALIFGCRGNVYRLVGEYMKAIDDYNKAIGLNGNYAGFYLGRAWAYAGALKYDNVISDCSIAIKLDEKCNEAYLVRGVAYGEKSDFKRALIDFNEYIKLNPKDARGYWGRGLVYSKQNDFDNCI